MSFKTSDWETDEVGDKMHIDLFKKKKQSKQGKYKTKKEKTKSKQKNVNKTVSDGNNDSVEKIQLNKTVLSTNITKNLEKILINSKKNLKNYSPVASKKVTAKYKQRASKTKLKYASEQVSRSTNIPKIKKKLKRLENKPIQKKNSNINQKTEKTGTVSGLNIANLKKQLATSLEAGQAKATSLRERMLGRLHSARFRYLNEQLYTSEGVQAQKLFQEDPEAFQAYHQGYRQQVERWPLNPLDTIIAGVKRMPSAHVIADFGCGEARLARSVPHTVHSFDLVSSREDVVACDMAHVPLKTGSVDVAVFCLSLMGTNLRDYLLEANRVLKVGGVLKIAEVESRFDGIQPFVDALRALGFEETSRDLSHQLFYFLDFAKQRNIKRTNKLPAVSLQPCLYKKR